MREKRAKNNIEYHTDGHDNSRADAEVLQCVCDDRLVVRHNALHVKGIVKYLAKCVQRATKQEAGACSQHQKTNNGLEGSFNNVLNRLFLQD